MHFARDPETGLLVAVVPYDVHDEWAAFFGTPSLRETAELRKTNANLMAMTDRYLARVREVRAAVASSVSPLSSFYSAILEGFPRG